jgi:hypothetical protein
MDDVERFIGDLDRLFAGNFDKDELRASARRILAAFIGRAAVRENAYAPPAEIHRILSEGRRRLHALTFEGEAYYLRVELLTELDKAINEVRPRG